MIRLIRVFFGLLLLRFVRRLPCGCFLSWVVRFVVWAGLAAALAALVRRLLGRKHETVTEYDVSGWTPPFGDQGNETRPTEPGEAHPWSAADTSAGPTMPDETLIADDEIDMKDEEVEAFAERIAEQVAENLGAAPVEDEEPEPEGDAGDAGPDPVIARSWIKGDGSIDCPEEFPIKAKASSQIYYVPGSNHYPVTIPDVCFESEEAAEQGGYRPPKR